MTRREIAEKPFLAELEKLPIIQVACKKVGVSRNSIYRWRKEDFGFAEKMDESMDKGIDFVNDMSENQLLTLIKEKKFSAIRFWLTHNHLRYMKKEKEVKIEENLDSKAIIKILGLTDEDFKDENLRKTTDRITDYLLSL